MFATYLVPVPRTGSPCTDMQHASLTFFAVSAAMSLFSHFSSPNACANARLHQNIELDYNLICCGRDGIEQQIIPNEENQSPGVQISRKLVKSD